MKNFLNKKGFSLIELLVVIAIIAILSAVIITNITSSRSKARDAKRISDIANIQLALEQFFDRCKRYPPASNVANGNLSDVVSGCPSGITLSSFISVLPTAPSPGTYEYSVRTDHYDYVLKATLENQGVGSNSGNPLDAFPTQGTWSSTLTCSNASDSTSYCVGPK